jgi:hypothetical protein
MSIGFGRKPVFRRRHRSFRRFFAEPPNYTMGGLYLVVATTVLVLAWLTLEGLFAAPRPSAPAASLEARSYGPFFVGGIGPPPHLDEQIDPMQISRTEPQLSATDSSEADAPAAPVEASGTSEPAASAAPEPMQGPETPAVADTSGASRRSGKLRLQLAAVKSAAAGERAWSDLQRQQADLLGPMKAAVSPADVPELGRVYRVRTAPVIADDARRLCDELRRRQVPCHLVR